MCGVVRCGAVQCCAVRCGAVLCGAVQCSAVWCGAVWCGGACLRGLVSACMCVVGGGEERGDLFQAGFHLATPLPVVGRGRHGQLSSQWRTQDEGVFTLPLSC